MTPGAASLDAFLAASERRALRIAQLATGDIDEALDLVQDAMIQLARHYASREPSEWPPLFHRILDNRIRKWKFRFVLRSRWLGRPVRLSGDDGGDAADTLPDAAAARPDQRLTQEQTLNRVGDALRRLPHRQRQAFLLRHWEGLSTQDTARAMACSEGSVKTHLSRALAALKPLLERQGVTP